jgi:hypothetical protein
MDATFIMHSRRMLLYAIEAATRFPALVLCLRISKKNPRIRDGMAVVTFRVGLTVLHSWVPLHRCACLLVVKSLPGVVQNGCSGAICDGGGARIMLRDDVRHCTSVGCRLTHTLVTRSLSGSWES